jgi:hypothetical protein
MLFLVEVSDGCTARWTDDGRGASAHRATGRRCAFDGPDATIHSGERLQWHRCDRDETRRASEDKPQVTAWAAGGWVAIR